MLKVRQALLYGSVRAMSVDGVSSDVNSYATSLNADKERPVLSLGRKSNSNSAAGIIEIERVKNYAHIPALIRDTMPPFLPARSPDQSPSSQCA